MVPVSGARPGDLVALGKLGAPRCHPELPPRSPSPSLTSSGTASRKGFAPEPVEDGSGTKEKQGFPSEATEVFQHHPHPHPS